MPIIDLTGKKGLVVGIANDKSIATGCARKFREAGAELAITYLNEKAEPHVRPLAEQLGASIILPCNLLHEGELEAVFAAITQHWGKLDFLLHAVAFAPKDDLQGRVVDCSRDGFLEAMDISCHSFMRMAKLAESLMTDGGCLLTVTFYGSQMVVPTYGLMGPVKAALESATRYMAAELGEKNIRVNALSPGLIATRAASGIKSFDTMLETARQKSPLHTTVTPDEVGNLAAFLVSDAARHITGTTSYIDAGYQIID